MKPSILPVLVLVVVGASFTGGCTSSPKKVPSPPAHTKKTPATAKPAAAQADDLQEYDVAVVADPLEPLNRATFFLNDGIYTYVFRPIAKGYKAIIPRPLREGVHNAFENVRFPVRFVNNTLQGNLPRAGQEAGKFLVNSTVGVGGLMVPAERIPALANVPEADTAQTLAKWGIGQGAYLVLPILGPSSTRDIFGLAGDYALNPVNWVTILYGGITWTLAIPSANTLRSTPVQMDQYDAATGESLDRYLAVRSSYVQFRANKKRQGTLKVVPAPAN